jgi:benzodiazapine receptor
MKKTFPQKLKLLLSFSFPLAIALLGGVFTAASVNSWYQTLIKPDFTPPNWVFGPVWLLLYLSIGLATYYFGKVKNQLK